MNRSIVFILRILLALPAAALGWIAVLLIGNYLLGVTAELFCPAGAGEGTDCYAPSWQYVEIGFQTVFAGISAVTVVLVAAVIFPTRRLHFSVTTYFIGAVLATMIAFDLGLWLSWLAAVTCGALAVSLVKNRIGDRFGAIKK